MTRLPSKDEFDQLDQEVKLAIYQEKYASHRHFDGLRWGTPTLVVASAGALFGFADPHGAARPYLLALFGVFALACAWLLHRLRVHSSQNILALRAVAESLGDNTVPTPAIWYKSAAFWFMLLTAATAIAALLLLAMQVFS